MASALIGYTGFVGSNLLRARSFDDLYNSSNIGNIVGKHYDLLVCAGVPAVKWKANKEPDRDREQIAALIDPLSKVTADRFILISTIDVYSNPSRPHDESKDPFDPEAQPYGKHRLEVEKWATAHFSDIMIVRLPALFGHGLKKNVIFDLLHDNQTDKIDPASSFQWYSLDRLWNDIETAGHAGLKLVNLFPEPVPTRAILDKLFPDAFVGKPSDAPVSYRLCTRHAGVFGQTGRYIAPASSVMDDIAKFVARERQNGGN
ncbi:NAD-dependent epimerase/dehydratase family protein [Brucella intermedia]|uniref:NAD-dependent epimerase/dehydratase family protein n=1 Tax=Brucella intermedia TaxID=94625 RepID=UPI00124D8A78|nr:NAD-dependent epimerase/dehydratase family protein [Brucella intermedia]KAB2715712.1 NAD(P)-dependent oxidoreductase [Brucella intermedia]KAB2717790.1 NAD(P)-dependent oxidoreductase [Brucella intermedia]